MLASGAVDLKPMITHRFKLEEAVEAFNVAKDPNSGSMKVMIKCSRD
jgi:L-iditol 2-dehydrogenase